MHAKVLQYVQIFMSKLTIVIIIRFAFFNYIMTQTDKLLGQVGNNGPFQIFSLILVVLMWTTMSIIIFLPSYLFQTPTFTCGNITNIKESDACPVISTCVIEQTHTITGKAGLYCDQLFVRNTIQSSQFAGSIAGLIILSHLSDKYGRKKIMISALIICLIGSILLASGAYIVELALLYIGIFMTGFGAFPLTLISFTYLSEVSSDEWRQRSYILTYSFWAIGQILLFPIISYITDWLPIICFIYFLPLVVLLIMSLFIAETPEFLFSQRLFDECRDTLNYIARFNKTSEIGPIFQSPEDYDEETSMNFKISFFTWEYMIPLVALCAAQFCASGSYYIIQYSIDEYGYRFQVNMLLVGSLEFASCFITNFLCPKIKRKSTIVSILIISAILGVYSQFNSNQIIDLVIIGLIRLFLTISLALFCVIAVETFPPSIRSRGLGIPETIANVGNMAAPFIVTFANDSNVKSVFIGGFMNVAAGLVMLLVKETKKGKSKVGEVSIRLIDDSSTAV